MKYTLSTIANITKGCLYGADTTATKATIDTRSIGGAEGLLFIALRGVARDGHNFVEAAARVGVRMFLVERLPDNWQALGSFVVVGDTLIALQEMATFHRQQFSGEVVAITGSNGKTVVKEWFFQLWPANAGRLMRSPRSFNSQIGVALSLLMIDGDERVAFIEAGISKKGEMERLKQMIQPTMGVLTNIGEAHAENFASSDEKLQEKLRLFSDCRQVIRGDMYHWPTIGEHNRWIVDQIYKTLNITPKKDETLTPLALRLEVQQGVLGSEIINDSYCNDLLSLAAALDFTRRSSSKKSRILILSDIEQSGLAPDALYAQVGAMVSEYGIDSLIGVGVEIKSQHSHFKGITSQFFDSTFELLEALNPSTFAGATVLIKGGRRFQFERVSARIEERTHTTTLEVNLGKMVDNLNHYRALAGSSKVMAMVKASSYGMGSVTVAKALVEAGASYLAVAFADEGVILRRGAITTPIVVLNSDPGSFAVMIDNMLEPEIYSFSSLASYVCELRKRGIEGAPIHIKLDTGMHRLGFMESEIEQLVEVLRGEACVRVASMFSHLAAAEDAAEDEFTKGQIALFNCMTSKLRVVAPTALRSIANTAGTERFAEARMDIVRVGIGLYENIATLATKITQTKRISAGETVGYNRRSIATKDMTIGIIPVGYADGISRKLSCGVGRVRVCGALCPVMGNVCMDTTIVDLSGVEGVVQSGDRVEVWGGDGLSAGEVAGLIGTISYEVLTGVSPRIKRLYVY